MHKSDLINLLAKSNINVKQDALSLILDYSSYILEMNKKINLTAIKDESLFLEKMVADCLLPLNYYHFEDKKIIDIGTGAGFPGALLSLIGLDVTLLDSTKKKLDIIDKFEGHSFVTVNDRAEQYALKHREEYDIAISRAVAPLNILCELCLPLVKVGGVFIALKGKEGNNELKLASNGIKKLGGKLENIFSYNLPCGDERCLIIIKKISPTQKRYPRSYNEIKTKPL